jgi:phenylacetate-CoA ligase
VGGSSREHFDPDREGRDPAARDAASLAQLKLQLERCYETIPFYRRHWDAAGFDPSQVSAWQDFTARCPVIDKKMLVADQAEHPPFGSYLGIEPGEIARVQASSGTSGTPTLYGVCSEDWRRAGHVFAMTQWAMGVRPDDTVQFAFPFSLFFGGWGVLYGAEKIGATCFPIGASETRRHVELMFRLGSTVLEATPSYALHMAEVATELGYDPTGSPLRRAVVGGEAGGAIESTRRRIIELWGLESVCDSGSTSEMFPFCTTTECTEMNGPHLFNDEVWTEIVDVEDPNAAVPEGERGATVYTHLWRTSQPMIRFASHDAAVLSSEPSRCGRTYPRLPGGVQGRIDDMLVVRGVNVYPSAIERALRETDGLGLEFRIYVDRVGEMDEVTVEVEPAGQITDENLIAELRARAQQALTHRCQVRLGCEIVPPGSFERTTMKARRVIDRRAAGAEAEAEAEAGG